MSQPPSDRILLSDFGPLSSEQNAAQQEVQDQACSAQGVMMLEELSRSHPIAKGDIPADTVIKAFKLKYGDILDANNVG